MEIMKLFFTKDEDLYDKKIEDFFDEEVFDSDFWLYWRTMFAFENWHSALEMKLYIQRFIHHIGGLPDFSALKFTKYNQYESLILPMQKYLEAAGVKFQFNTRVENVIFEFKDGKKIARTIECNVKGKEETIELTENDLVFVTNGSCTESTIYGDHTHAPVGDAEVRTSGRWSLGRILQSRIHHLDTQKSSVAMYLSLTGSQLQLQQVMKRLSIILRRYVKETLEQEMLLQAVS